MSVGRSERNHEPHNFSTDRNHVAAITSGTRRLGKLHVTSTRTTGLIEVVSSTLVLGGEFSAIQARNGLERDGASIGGDASNCPGACSHP